MPRIFIVEDEAMIVMELRDRLADLGYIVCGSAARGEVALANIPDSQADIVLMDIHLAGKLNGIETAERLRETCDVPVLFLTAHTDPVLLQQAGKVDPFGFLVKPFEERELHATIQMALHKYQIEQKLLRANVRLEEMVEERTVALKSANHRLRESERFVSATLDSLSAHICVIDQHGNILSVNRAWREFADKNQLISGSGSQVLEGSNYLAVCESCASEGVADAVAFSSRIREMINGERVGFSMEYACHSPSEQRWFVAHVTRLVGEGPIRIVIAHETITERKLIESNLARSNEALRLSDEQRREAQRLARLGHWELDPASGSIEWCDQAYEIFGLDRAKFSPDIATYYSKIVHPDDVAAVQLEEKLAYSSGRQHRIDHRFIHVDGSIRWVHIEGIAVFDAAGQPQLLHGTVQDITESKRAEEQRRALELQLREAQKKESDAMLASIIGSALDAIITVDEMQHILVFNHAAEGMFRCAASDAIGQHLNRFIPKRFHTAHGNYMARYRQTGNSGRVMGEATAVRAIRADGEEFSVEASISHVELQGRHLYSVVMRDITARLATEKTQRELEAQLRESQKMEAMGTLAGGIAHDFNNILAAIMGNTAIAMKDVGADNRALVSLEEINKASRRGRNLVQQILTFGRRQPQEMVVQPLRPLVEESIGLMRATLPAMVSFEEKFSDKPIYVRADATQIGQVLMNLCTNAWHALPENSGRMVICLESIKIDALTAERTDSLRPGDYAQLTVSDNGCGMDEATLARIFEPFFTTKSVGKGTGLGLPVVHGIVKAHCGAISIKSEPGKGTIVEVLLPMVEAQIQPLQSAPTVFAPASGRGRRVMYVDDDEALVFMVTRMLEELDYRVIGYESAEVALAAVRAHPYDYDLIVTDFNMAEVSGLDLAIEVALINPKLPVVITSGYITEELREGAQKAGVIKVVYKPDTVDELCEIVQRLLDVEDT